MSKVSYKYERIENLESGSEKHNFYGKIVFIGKRDDTIILLLRDETSTIYLWVTPDNNQKLTFRLKQVLRVHRCIVQETLNFKQAYAHIGVAGCHIIAWPQFGDVNNPAVISSKTWTKSREDEERLEVLSELYESDPEAEVEEIDLIDYRESEIAKDIVKSWLNKTKIDNEMNTTSLTEELSNRPVGSSIQSRNIFTVDRSFFNEQDAGRFVDFVSCCSRCFPRSNEVRYNSTHCVSCKEPSTQLAVRVRVESSTHSTFFTIPVRLIEKEFDNFDEHSLLDCFKRNQGEAYKERIVVQFREKMQKTLWNASITRIKGIVTLASAEAKFTDIYLTEAEFINLNQ